MYSLINKLSLALVRDETCVFEKTDVFEVYWASLTSEINKVRTNYYTVYLQSTAVELDCLRYFKFSR